jgi:hypothetical protein
MKPPQFSVKSLANDITVTHNDSPTKRIRTDFPPPAPRKLKSPPKVRSIRACQLRIHATD